VGKLWAEGVSGSELFPGWTIQELKNFGLHNGVIVEDRFIYCDSARLQGTCTNGPLYDKWVVSKYAVTRPELWGAPAGSVNIRRLIVTDVTSVGGHLFSDRDHFSPTKVFRTPSKRGFARYHSDSAGSIVAFSFRKANIRRLRLPSAPQRCKLVHRGKRFDA
jgi:hypothetical protein